MTDVQIKLRYNPEAEEVELVVGDEVVGSSGQPEFASWVENYNEVHPQEPVVPEETEEDKLRAQLEETNTQLEAARAELEVAHAANEQTPDPAPVDADAEV